MCGVFINFAEAESAMDSSVNRSKWRKRSQRNTPIIFIISFFFFLSLVLFFFPSNFKTLTIPELKNKCIILPKNEEKFMWYAPHSGFSNQLSEFKSAILISAILNRTLIVPPVLDHHAVALGSCPKFRVKRASELRIGVWDHIMQLVNEKRYVSIADIVDLSSVTPSMIKIVDFRAFASLWCGINIEKACFNNLCCTISKSGSSTQNPDQYRSLLSGLQGNIHNCFHAVEEDCRTTVWTYQQEHDNTLDGFQPDEELKKKKKLNYIRKRRDIKKALGPGSTADSATVLSFGSLFTSPYRGSESYIDIHEAPNDPHIQSLINKIEFLPFSPEIIKAGKEFALEKIKEPFLCAQLRLLDGQFKNHWRSTFSALEEKIKALQSNSKVHIFIMTDLPRSNWTGTYLDILAKDTQSYEMYMINENDDLVVRAGREVMAAEHALKSSFVHEVVDLSRRNRSCDHSRMVPDVLLYVEETVCSCASLGFVGTAGSTIAESIEIMRKNEICKL